MTKQEIMKWTAIELILLLELLTQDPELEDSILLNQIEDDLRKLSSYISKRTNIIQKSRSDILEKLNSLKSITQNRSSFTEEEIAVFKYSCHEQEKFTRLAFCLRSFLNTNMVISDEIEEYNSAHEGFSKETLHFKRERDYKIIKAKKQSVLAEKGKLECEVCEFNFQEIYGIRGGNYIEVHHMIPLSDYQHPRITFLEDLALLCSNCHRMIHRAEPWLTVEELRRIYKEGRAA